jgi:hypothetical protein
MRGWVWKCMGRQHEIITSSTVTAFRETTVVGYSSNGSDGIIMAGIDIVG